MFCVVEMCPKICRKNDAMSPVSAWIKSYVLLLLQRIHGSFFFFLWRLGLKYITPQESWQVKDSFMSTVPWRLHDWWVQWRQDHQEVQAERMWITCHCVKPKENVAFTFSICLPNDHTLLLIKERWKLLCFHRYLLHLHLVFYLNLVPCVFFVRW